MSETNCSLDSADDGITVPGSQSNQQFFHTNDFPTYPQTDVVILRLRGELSGRKVTKPITTNMKPKCSVCGTANKGKNQFCSDCGTALQIF